MSALDHEELEWLRSEVKRLRGMISPPNPTHDLVADLRAPSRYRIWERTPFFTELHAVLMRMAADEIERLRATAGEDGPTRMSEAPARWK